MHDVQIWVLSGIVLVSGMVIGFFSKAGFNLVVKLLAEIKEEIKTLVSLTERHEYQIKTISEAIADHETRLRKIEQDKNIISSQIQSE